MATSLVDRIAELPVFDGFPYLIIRVVPAMYHVTLLPEAATERGLAGIARAQWLANRLDVCFVIGPERALYINNPAGLDQWDAMPPRGGTLITGKLRPPTTWPDTSHLRARRGRLNVRAARLDYAKARIGGEGHTAAIPAWCKEDPGLKKLWDRSKRWISTHLITLPCRNTPMSSPASGRPEEDTPPLIARIALRQPQAFPAPGA